LIRTESRKDGELRRRSFHDPHFGGNERVVVYQMGGIGGDLRRDFGVAEPSMPRRPVPQEERFMRPLRQAGPKVAVDSLRRPGGKPPVFDLDWSDGYDWTSAWSAR
jgi:hypothetical protein